jgi:hypothetical protein
MRLLFGRSSLLSSLSASAENSILNAMTIHQFLQWNRGFFPAADTFQAVFGEVDVFKIFEILQNGFADVEGLRSPGAACEFSRRFSIDCGSRMASMATSLYKYGRLLFLICYSIGGGHPPTPRLWQL